MFKDALYLRRIYEKFYGQVQPPLVSKYWVPQWSGENPDSSARLLDIFDTATEHKKLERDVGQESADSPTNVNNIQDTS